jgi:hypothetical protein
MSATDPMTLDPRRFSIRLPRPLWIGLFTGVLIVVATGLQIILPIWRQQRAIREIQRLGGRMVIENGGPEWLRARVGDEHMKYFDRVVGADLTVKSVDDSTLRHVAALDNLQALWLGNSRISDDGLVHLRGMAQLEQLWLGNTRVTDAGLVQLRTLRRLHELSLGNTDVSDVGLAHIQGLRALQRLSLGNTRVTEVGVADLQRALPRLTIEK